MKAALSTAASAAFLYCALLCVLVVMLHRHGSTLQDFAVGPSGDQWEYATLSHSIAEQGSFKLLPVGSPQAEFFRTPGYPLLAALALLVSTGTSGILLLQIVLVAAGAGLLVFIGEKLYSSWLGIIAAALYVLDPTTILTAFSTLSDTLFTFLLLVCVYIILCRPLPRLDAVLIGFVGGFAALTRPLGLYLLAFFIAWYVYELWHSGTRLRELLVQTFLLCAAGLLVLLPWAVRNELLGGHFSLSTAGSYNMLFYNLVEFESSTTGDSKETILAHIYKEVGTSDGVALRSFAYANQINAVTTEHLTADLPRYGVFHLEKTAPYFLSSSVEQGVRILHQKKILLGEESPDVNISSLVLSGQVVDALHSLVQNPFGLLERLGWLLVGLFACAGLVLGRGRVWIRSLALCALVLALAVLTGPVSFPRYRLPAEPLLFLASGMGFVLLVTQARLWLPKTSVPEAWREFARYACASVAALVADAGLLFVFASVFGVNYLWAGAFSFLFGLAVIYTLSVTWVFTKRRIESRFAEFAFFAGVGFAGLAINEGVLALFTGVFGLYYLISKLLSILVVFGWNFLARWYLLFR